MSKSCWRIRIRKCGRGSVSIGLLLPSWTRNCCLMLARKQQKYANNPISIPGQRPPKHLLLDTKHTCWNEYIQFGNCNAVRKHFSFSSRFIFGFKIKSLETSSCCADWDCFISCPTRCLSHFVSKSEQLGTNRCFFKLGFLLLSPE